MRWMRRLVGVTLVVSGMVIGWWFAAANDAVVRIDYIWGQVEHPLWQALVGCFAVGFALAGSIGLWFGLRAKLVQRRYRKTVGGLESEIHQLRNLPLSPDADGSGPEAGSLRAGHGGRGRGA